MRAANLKRIDKMYNQKSTKTYKGFTLIELMIAVAIVGIIASIAYPSYQDSIRKARRSDGIEAALACAANLKKLFTAVNTFQGTLPFECGGAPGNGLSSEGFYRFTFPQRTATQFTITMQRQGAQVQDTQCGDFTLTNTGRETVSGSGTVQDCWR